MPSAPNPIAAPRPPPPHSRPNGNNPGLNPVSQNQNNSGSFQYVPKNRPVVQDSSDDNESDSDWKNSYSVSKSYPEILKTNYESSSRKKQHNTRKNNSAILKLGILIMLRDGYTYRKSKKRFSNQTNQKKKKTIFISNLCQKITDIVTQKLKKKKEQIFRENIYRHHVKINQIACLIITFHLRHRSIIDRVLNYFANY